MDAAAAGAEPELWASASAATTPNSVAAIMRAKIRLLMRYDGERKARRFSDTIRLSSTACARSAPSGRQVLRRDPAAGGGHAELGRPGERLETKQRGWLERSIVARLPGPLATNPAGRFSSARASPRWSIARPPPGPASCAAFAGRREKSPVRDFPHKSSRANHKQYQQLTVYRLDLELIAEPELGRALHGADISEISFQPPQTKRARTRMTKTQPVNSSRPGCAWRKVKAIVHVGRSPDLPVKCS
jgi:hypothetical protein